MLTIGLTGGIGSGKSTVAELFKARGITVVDADVIARQLVEPGRPALQEIVARFGAAILNRDGTLNRAALREQVFSDPGLRTALESILHPLVWARIAEEIKQSHGPYCIAAIPLLAESRHRHSVDRVLVVDAPESAQVSRTQTRDGLTSEQVQAIIHSQCSREQRLKIADDVIHNDGSLAQLELQVQALHQRYLELSAASQ